MQTIYTMHTLARLLQVSTRTIRREVDEGKLHFVKIRGRIRFRQEDVQAYLNQCTRPEMESKEAPKANQEDSMLVPFSRRLREAKG